MIYYALLVWYISCPFVFSSLKPRLRKALVFFASAIPSALLIGLRTIDVGKDGPMYFYTAELFAQYGDFQKLGDYGRFEPGFNLLVRFSALFGAPGRTLLLLCAFLTIGLAFYAAYIVSEKPQYVYVLYFFSTTYFFNFCGVRQSLAIACVMLASAIAYKNNWLMSILLVLVAGLFHKTALLVLPIFIIARWNITWKVLVPVGGVGIVASVLLRSVDLQHLFKMLGYGYYVNSQFDQGATKLPLLFGCFFLVLIVFFERQIWSNVADGSNEQMTALNETAHVYLYRIARYACYEGMIIASMLLLFGTLYRAEYYLMTIPILILPTMLDKIRSVRERRVSKIVVYGDFILVYAVFMLFVSSWFNVFPYKSILQ